MSDKLVCVEAVERLGYYAADMFHDFKLYYEAVDGKVKERLLVIDQIYGFDKEEVNSSTLLKLEYRLNSIDKFVTLSESVFRVAQKYSEESTGPNHKIHGEVEDAAFVLIEVALTMRSVCELIQELDPLQEYSAKYIGTFAQGL